MFQESIVSPLNLSSFRVWFITIDVLLLAVTIPLVVNFVDAGEVFSDEG